MTIIPDYAPLQSCLLSIANYLNSKYKPLQRRAPLNYIPCSFLGTEISHTRPVHRLQTHKQEDSKMAEYIDRMSLVSTEKA